ncbi:TPA: aminotransferase class I/II-fold pyridoxal phosphate-dependent enzyme, partial [Vibrio parahaemolyticus]|nr:aminotransferase class I/II-fold pyridoxal phosphate-dependent enzyme [Vibrio parahaemolyticus]
SSDADALYITPSNQYPMGTTLNTEQRGKIINWAVEQSSWIIEDDYDSEFQFAHRPYTSLQGLAAQMGRDDRVLYVGSFSKVMFNGLRLGYLVVPERLVEQCLVVKDALSGDSPTHTQEALADFITEGGLLRHIRKMRRLYKTKHEQMHVSIQQHFGDRVCVVSQAAGLHVTLKWQDGMDEQRF